MKKLLIGKRKEKYCMYCKFGKYLQYSDEVFCSKKGFVDKFNKCTMYKYDILKRVPTVNEIGHTYTKEDFLI